MNTYQPFYLPSESVLISTPIVAIFLNTLEYIPYPNRQVFRL